MTSGEEEQNLRGRKGMAYSNIPRKNLKHYDYFCFWPQTSPGN
jgi:hypothetical protein